MPNEEFEKKLAGLKEESQKLERQLYEILTSNQLFKSIKILEKIVFTAKLIRTNEINGKKTAPEVFKSKNADCRKFLDSIQHLSASKCDAILNVFKEMQQVNKKISALKKENSDLQDENVESYHEKNENQSTHQIPKAIEEQKLALIEKKIEQQEENTIDIDQEEKIFKIDREYVDNLALRGQWGKIADYFENLASKIQNSSRNNLIPVSIWEDCQPTLIDKRYSEIFLECYFEYEKAKEINELRQTEKERFIEKPIEIDYKKIKSLSLKQRQFYILDCIREIIMTPFYGGNSYLVSLGDKIYTIDKKYAEVYTQYMILYKKNEKELREKEISEITQTAEDYVNLKNKIAHRISISNMEHYNYESQKDKEEIEAIVNDVNKYLYLQGRLKYFMKDSKDQHLLKDPFNVDEIFAIYEKFNKNNVKPEKQKNLNTSQVPIRTEKFKINWKEISRLSIKDKIEALEQAMIAMINAPKENITSVNVDDTNYIINKKDERVFNKCYNEYKKNYFPVYNNNFSTKFFQILHNHAVEIFEQPSNIINESPFQKKDEMFSSIKNKIGMGIKTIKTLTTNVSNSIMRRINLGTVKVKAGTYNILDENIHREENRYGR